MAIRPHPTKGPGWWQIRISQGRKQKEKNYTYQGSQAEALSFEAELRGLSADAIDQKLCDILGRFLDWYHLHRSSRAASDCERSLPRVINRIGNKHISLLRQQDYDRYKAARINDGVTRRTINIELTYLRAMLHYAIDELQLPTPVLPKLYTKKQTQPPEIIPFTPEEISRFLVQLTGDKKTIAMLYAWCGLRRNEALHLQTQNIDFETNLIYVTGKGNKHRIVPIVGQELRHRLKLSCQHIPQKQSEKQIDPQDKERLKRPDEYLFICPRTKKPYRNIVKGFKAAAERAKINKPIWNHLLRHSGATAAVQAGVDLRTLQTLLGHSDIRMTERYTHIAAGMMQTAGDKLDAIHKTAKQNTSGMSGTKTTKNHQVIQLFKKRPL